ncbi:prepilin signal peptidase PulO-like peptidase [Thioflavicoccus mobilis 8321]|uniref:Prepilin leader peptidase/N-methyltransferase n=1 Tax=Thioflavicoccus mobilis 8321 TaxID=765912 RepID=L0GSV8_9GAMM|nr:A24 family peptidase [Thioflavicoccus mobilis]AGA89853.1 prepilin signal peptidase PulO-like peptidase [Thioflavicoccus mobilis 8321]
MAWLETIGDNPILLLTITGLFGLVIGSFLNVVILRLPQVMQAAWQRDCAELAGEAAAEAASGEPLTLSKPPSRCRHCGHRIRFYENIPILSFLVLRGRCSACHEAIGWRYPAIEALTALLSVAVVWHFGPTLAGAAALVLTWGLISLAIIDLETQFLPDAITLPLLWFGLLLSLTGIFADSRSAILGAAIGYLSLWSLFHLFRLATGKEGMGYGDFKLFALFGAWLGWTYLPQIILLSAFSGAIIGVMLILSRGHDRQAPLPFGPYLAIAGWISLIWGDTINQGYLNWSGLG